METSVFMLFSWAERVGSLMVGKRGGRPRGITLAGNGMRPTPRPTDSAYLARKNGHAEGGAVRDVGTVNSCRRVRAGVSFSLPPVAAGVTFKLL